MSCEVIRLDYVLLLMDTVNVSSQVRMIAYRVYRTRVQYNKHYLGNVNNTPSSVGYVASHQRNPAISV